MSEKWGMATFETALFITYLPTSLLPLPHICPLSQGRQKIALKRGRRGPTFPAKDMCYSLGGPTIALGGA